MTIGEHLELERLRYHEQRLRLAIRELRVRARSVDGSVPEGLRKSLQDFELQLRAVRSRLQALEASYQR
jgi:hypothetical protein